MTEDQKLARDRLLTVLPHLRLAAQEAKEKGKPALGILAVNADNSGQIICKFACEGFLKDLALALDAPPMTEEDTMRAKAQQFLNKFGLKQVHS